MLRRAAERLVDQVPPEENFLGALASSGGGRIEVLYPASLSAKLVRRRLRLLTRTATWHRRWSLVWGIVTPLLIPLVLSPISNIPIVYTFWRWYAHRNAAAGADLLATASLEMAPCQDLEHLAPRAWSDEPIQPTDACDFDGLDESLDRKLRWLQIRGELPALPLKSAASS